MFTFKEGRVDMMGGGGALYDWRGVTDLMSSGLVVTGFSIAARQNIWIETLQKVQYTSYEMRC